MTIQDWGALGEIIGGFGVIITLLYLATQIRQNTKHVASASLQAMEHDKQATQSKVLKAWHGVVVQLKAEGVARRFYRKVSSSSPQCWVHPHSI